VAGSNLGKDDYSDTHIYSSEKYEVFAIEYVTDIA
jgi:hypothetical protein